MNQQRDSEPHRAPSRALAKALRDPFYAAVVRHFGAEHLESAGFFDDGAPVGTDMTVARDPRLLVTPLAKARDELARRVALGTEFGDGPVVLIASGAFCPIHDGHLEMMESAKRELERRGRVVVGGFLAPDHDGYVAGKCGEGSLSGAERVRLTQVATSQSTWLQVDPWAALHVDRAVNYTDIIRRLSAYLRLHLRSDIEVVFVCGADNTGFSKAFVEEGMLVIVPRGGHSLSIRRSLLATDRILIADDHEPNMYASRAIRGGHGEGLSRRVESEREALSQRHRVAKVTIRLRDEEEWAIEPWAKVIDAATLARAQRDFTASLLQVFEETLSRGYPTAKVSVSRLSLSKQRELVEKFAQRQTVPILSLDACIPGDFSVGLSRHFEVTGGERLKGLFPRPGCGTIESQLRALPPGRYIVMDDDIATGETIRHLIAMLPSHVTVERVVSIHQLELNESLATVENEGADGIIDVGDVRDFLLGARDGGLVARLPNGLITRAPYLFPYAQNYLRMSLPLSEERTFSHSVWKLNERFFSELPVALRVGDASEAFRSLGLYLGFNEDTSLSEVCSWHVRELS